MKYDTYEIFVCDCSDASHNIIFQLWEWGDEHPELSVHVNLGDYPSFWRRVWLAVRYIFGYKSKYGQYDVMTIRVEDLPRMMSLLENFKNKVEQFRK